MMQNLYFGTGSEARWLEGGSRFPADLVPRTLACQQQVPKTELCALEVADTGWGRHPWWRRRNSVTSAVTVANRVCHGSWLCLTAGSLSAITGLPDISELLPAMSEPPPVQRPSQGDGLGEAQRGVSTWCSHSPPRHGAGDSEVLYKAFTTQQSCWQPGTTANPTITNQGVSQRQKTTW